MYVWCTHSSTSGARLRLGSSLPPNLFVCLILFNSFVALSQECWGIRGGCGCCLGLDLGFFPGLYDQGCWIFSRGSSHILISPVVKSVITEAEAFSLWKCSQTHLSLLFPCCLSRNKIFQLEQNHGKWGPAQRQVPEGGL